jgi:protein-arginine kinase activator protein McsA
MEQAGIMFTEAGAEEPSTDVTTAAASSSALPALHRKLAQAVADEHYEDAAGLRDQIKKLTSSN